MIKPLFERVLIEVKEEKEEQTKSGIIISEKIKKNERLIGTIISKGTGIPVESEYVKVGVKVCFIKPYEPEARFEEGDRIFYLVDTKLLLGIYEE